jgi:hypothetical protein
MPCTPVRPYDYIVIFVVFRLVGIRSESGFTSLFPALALPWRHQCPILAAATGAAAQIMEENWGINTDSFSLHFS